jgi:hypothetical protein
MSGEYTDRAMTVLQNSKDFIRYYNGIEISWDIPIGRRFNFGGSYTYARQIDNQSLAGTSYDFADSSDRQQWGFGGSNPGNINYDRLGETSPAWQTLWYWDEKFAQIGLSRDDYMPKLNRNPEFNANYYIIVNLTQGRAKSNFTLRGYYTGAYEAYDSINYYFGYPYLPGVIEHPTSSSQRIGGMRSTYSLRVNKYTRESTHKHDLTYNLTLPIVKKLSWYMNLSVNNVFNHRPKIWSVPGGIASGTILPFDITNHLTGEIIEGQEARNPLYEEGAAYGMWRYRNSVGSFYKKGGLGVRYFDLSTGLRF